MKIDRYIGCLCLLGGLTQAVMAQSLDTGNQNVEKVFVAFKTHLDIGFTGLSRDITALYQNEFIPAALDLSERLNKDAASGSYAWTTGSWLVWDYLEHASIDQSARMEAAIRRGDFWWHAFPFTMQVELCDSSLLSTSLSISEALDKRFGRKTCAVKITDVPGVSRSLIPVLKRHGITMLHLGANSGAARPELPEVFRWKDDEGNAVNVVCQTEYARPFKIPSTNNIVVVNFTNDNHGPHSEEAIAQIYKRLSAEYPQARLIPASLSDIAQEIEKVQNQLPVVTKEWGDTWIYGVGSDPKKIAEFRELSRLRNQWIREGKLQAGSDTDIAFVIPMMLVAEHTWGLDVKTFLKHYDRYRFDRYPDFLIGKEANCIEKSWNEQRAYIYQAISTLPSHLGREAIAALNRLLPVKPVLEKEKKYVARKIVDTRFFQARFNMNTGTIDYLKNKKENRVWADDSSVLGEFTYQIYSDQDFKDFISRYCPENPSDWMVADYGKPGLDKLGLKNRIISYRVKEIVTNNRKDRTDVLVRLFLNVKEEYYGAPQEVSVCYSFSNDSPKIEIELSWFGKHKNRIPEAVWFSFQPCLQQAKVYVDKLNARIDVQDVVYNGARTIHGITKDVSFVSANGQITIESLDAPLIQFNKRHLLSFDNEVVEADKGVHFCLLNNLWGTNYTQWFGDDMKYRFVVHSESLF